MNSKTIINYDTPWEEILDAAKQPLPGQQAGGPCAKTVMRGLLTDEELTALAGIPICTVDITQAPPALPDINSDNPERGSFLRKQAEEKNWPFADYMYWPQVGTNPCSSVSRRYLKAGNSPAMPKERSAKSGNYGSEFDLRPPLSHRLDGDMIPVLAVIASNHDTGQEYFQDKTCHPEDQHVLTQLHEMFHTLQLQDSTINDPLLSRVREERDAEQGALTAFQTHFGGSPTVAARSILARTTSLLLNTSASYYFWPGLQGHNLQDGTLIAGSLFVKGMYIQNNSPVPDGRLIAQAVLHHAGIMPPSIYQECKNDIDPVRNFVASQIEEKG